MIFRKIAIHELTISLWKNGGGKTREVDVFPTGSTPSSPHFLFRVSCADIEKDGPFSTFSQCHRQLFIWSGSGIYLNLHPIYQYHSLQFNGEDEVYCKLMDENVLDIGIIYNPQSIIAVMDFIEKKPDETYHALAKDYNYLFILEGKAIANNTAFQKGDVLIYTEDDQPLILKAQEAIKLLHIGISLTKNSHII